MSVPRLDGWVPIRMFWQGSTPWFDWCYFGRQRFDGQFFDSSVSQVMRLPFNQLFRQRTPIDVLEQWHEQSPGLKPAAFVFHMARCGSTLVSRLLGALERNVVICEAGPLDAITRSHLRAPAASLEERILWLQWLVSAMGQRREGEQAYVIKFDSPVTLELPLIRRAFPEVPWIFIYRDPVEVLVSILRESSAAYMPTPVGQYASRLGYPELVHTPLDEFAARVVGNVCEAAVRHFDGLGLAVNYTELPDAVWGRIGRHAGLDFAADEVARMKEVAGFHSKRPGVKFEPDIQAKQEAGNERLHLLAEQWIVPHYRKLEEFRAQGL